MVSQSQNWKASQLPNEKSHVFSSFISISTIVTIVSYFHFELHFDLVPWVGTQGAYDTTGSVVVFNLRVVITLYLISSGMLHPASLQSLHSPFHSSHIMCFHSMQSCSNHVSACIYSGSQYQSSLYYIMNKTVYKTWSSLFFLLDITFVFHNSSFRYPILHPRFKSIFHINLKDKKNEKAKKNLKSNKIK